MARRSRQKEPIDPATQAFNAGCGFVAAHPLFEALYNRVHVHRQKGNFCPADGWAVVVENGTIHAHATRRGEPEEWAYVLAHALLHLAFGHFRIGEKSLDWNAACDVVVTRFLRDLKFGRCPVEMQCEIGEGRNDDEDALFRRFRDRGRPEELRGIGTAGESSGDMFWTQQPLSAKRVDDWTRAFAAGLEAAVTSAVRVAGGYESHLGATSEIL
ncbi:MAG TPA: peptidase, partial [Thermoanaerobaculia bacterium]